MILSAYTIFNVQLLLDSRSASLTIRWLTRASLDAISRIKRSRSVDGFFDNTKFNFNPFIASGSIGMCIDEFNGDKSRSRSARFCRRRLYGASLQTGGRPIETTLVPPGTPKWGAAWKKAARDNYLCTVKPGTGVHGSSYSYRDVYLDLDPTYKDRFGRPLMQITIDLHDNEMKQNQFLTDKFAEIIKAMGADTSSEAIPNCALRHYAIPNHASERWRDHGH